MSKLDAIGTPELRATLLYVRAQSGAVSAADAAQALSVPKTVARWRLEKLASSGLLRTSFERRGRGRPVKTYSQAPESAQIEFPTRHYERLVSLLMRHRNLRKVGAEFGRELAALAGLRAGAGLEALCTALGKLGFQASVAEGGEALLSATCPLRPIVVADPDARAIDEGMWSALVGAATEGARARCSTHGCRERGKPCRISVTVSG